MKVLLILMLNLVAFITGSRYTLTVFHLNSNDTQHKERELTLEYLINNVNSNFPNADLTYKSGRLHLLSQVKSDNDHLSKLIQSNLSVPNHNVEVSSVDDESIKDGYTKRKRRSVKDFDLNAFNTYDSIMDYLDDLQSQYPDIVKAQIIGYTVHQRPIKVVEINVNHRVAKPRIFIDGAQHAREWISPSVLLHLMYQMINGFNKKNATVTDLLQRYDFHFLPILNPDGYEYSYEKTANRFWRKNRRNLTDSNCTGVDLNRNWDFHWSDRGGSQDSCSNMYHGESPFSEPETAAASQYILNKTGWHSYFSFHSFGQMILFPYSHTGIPGPEFSKHMYAARSLASGIQTVNNRKYSSGAVGALLYVASGSSESWAYSVGIPYAFTVELPDLRTFAVPSAEIEPTATEWMKGLITYFNHTEWNDPNIYTELQSNITDVEGVWEDDPGLQESSSTVHNYCSILFIFSFFLSLKCSIFY